MLDKNKENILFQMFFDLDEMCKALDDQPKICTPGSPRYSPRPRLSESEIMTILCFYHYSGYKCFEYYYQQMVLGDLKKTFFPKAVSYHRFIELIPRVAQLLYLFTQVACSWSDRTGIYFADSKKLPVCDNKRIHANQVFKKVAGRGKSSTGWFFGLKLHLIVNNVGQIVQFGIAPANVADNDKRVLDWLLNGIKGKCFADKGYLTKYFEQYVEQGVQIVTKIRKNMKNKLMHVHDKMWLRKRAVIESINDLLMSVFDVDHTRHRNPWNAVVHTLAGIAAYAYYPNKPSVFIKMELN
jgi:hypothetical protein